MTDAQKLAKDIEKRGLAAITIENLALVHASLSARVPEELVPQKPIAWLHRRHTTAYVITDTIKQLWLKAKPEHVENYTVPLYFGESLAAPVSPQLIPTEKP